jgi:hypothetical protein
VHYGSVFEEAVTLSLEVRVGKPKEIAQDVLKNVPDDCSFADIEYHLRIRELIEEGRRDLRDGRTFIQDEIERDLAQWLGR